MKSWRQFLREEDGPTATEYAVLLSTVILALAVSVKLLGVRLRDNMVASTDTIVLAFHP
jgi:Flp pilus assembly pilin Flp